MLTIRLEQVEALGAMKLSSFKAKMMAHLQKVFPKLSAEMGAEQLRDFIGHGISRAKLYGFLAEVDVARYLHVMQKLGKQFDESSDYSWASELLSSELPGPEKMDLL